MAAFRPTVATGVSGDGSTAFATESVLSLRSSPASRWTRELGTVAIGTGMAWAGTPDGSLIVGFNSNGAWYWTAETGALVIPGLAQAYCVSRDGVWVGGGRGGSSWAEVWSAATGVLTIPAGGPLFGLSADGSVAVGGQDPAFRAINRVPTLMPPNTYGRAVSVDGSIWAGQITLGSGLHPCTFTTTGYTLLPRGGTGDVRVRGMSADGSIVVGSGGPGACLWINGVYRDLTDYLAEAIGFYDPDWQFNLVRGVSDDGLVFVGEGVHREAGSWRERGWVADLRAGFACDAIFHDQPASRRLSDGDDLVLTTHYTTIHRESPRWHKDGVPLEDGGRIFGSGTAALEVRDLRASDSGVYAFIIPAACGDISSDIATISVAPPATIRYVNPAGTTPGNGSSWSDAYTTLPPALAASQSGDEVWIRAGRVIPTGGATGVFAVPAGVTVRGGFDGTETAPGDRDPALVHATILSGDQPVNDSARVVAINGTVTLDRLVISDADSTGATTVSRGAGCVVNVGSLLAIDCLIQNNRATNPTSGGGALGLANNTSAALVRTRLQSNSIRVTGAFGMEGCGIYGTIASLALIDSQIADSFGVNNASGCMAGQGVGRFGGVGGAIYAERCRVTLRGSDFTNNTGGPGSNASFCGTGYFTGAAAGGKGGAIYLTGVVAEIARCTFIGNRAGNGGRTSSSAGGSWTGLDGGSAGAVYYSGGSREHMVVENCLFAFNRAGNGSAGGEDAFGAPGGSGGAGGTGGAIMIGANGSVATIRNCTFVGNHAGQGGSVTGALATPGVPGTSAAIHLSGLPIPITNCVFDNNFSGDSSLADAIDRIDSVRSSLVQSDASEAGLTFTGAPLFASPLGPDGLPASGDEDFAPRADSPLIDRGDNSVVTSVLDAAGRPRIVDQPLVADSGIGTAPFVDLGAFEAQPGENCPADMDGDRDIDSDDVTIFFAQWEEANAASDIDQDSDTDSDDIVLFFARLELGC